MILVILCLRIIYPLPEPLNEPPKLTATAADSSGSKIDVYTELAVYLWGGEMTYGGPLEAMKDEKAVTVPAGAEMTLLFAQKAPDEVTIRLMKVPSGFKKIESTERGFRLPDQPGEYVYGIDGEWREGFDIQNE